MVVGVFADKALWGVAFDRDENNRMAWLKTSFDNLYNDSFPRTRQIDPDSGNSGEAEGDFLDGSFSSRPVAPTSRTGGSAERIPHNDSFPTFANASASLDELEERGVEPGSIDRGYVEADIDDLLNERLTAEERRLYDLRFVDGMTVKDISEKLRQTVPWVNGQITQIRKKLLKGFNDSSI